MPLYFICSFLTLQRIYHQVLEPYGKHPAVISGLKVKNTTQLWLLNSDNYKAPSNALLQPYIFFTAYFSIKKPCNKIYKVNMSYWLRWVRLKCQILPFFWKNTGKLIQVAVTLLLGGFKYWWTGVKCSPDVWEYIYGFSEAYTCVLILYIAVKRSVCCVQV